MAQKLILVEGTTGQDVLAVEPIAGLVARGYEVVSASCYSTRDNRHVCAVLLTGQGDTDDSGDGGDPNINPGNDEQPGGRL